MTKPSRRGLGRLCQEALPSSNDRNVDPRACLARPRSDGALAARIAAWIAHDARLTAMQLEWQTCERAVFDQAKRLNLSCEDASLSDWPAARAMRELDTQIAQSRQHLEAETGTIRKQPAATLADALAKIELGLKVQGPFDWREHALDLIQDGLTELRRMTAGLRA